MTTNQFGNAEGPKRLGTEAVLSSSYFDDINDVDVEMLEEERERDFQEWYDAKDLDGLSPFDRDVLYHSELCHEDRSNYRPMQMRFRKLSKDSRNHGLNKHRDSKVQSRVDRRMSTLTQNPTKHKHSDRERDEVPKQNAKRILHKQNRVQLRQGLSHIHHISDVPIVIKTTLDENPKKIRIVQDDYEVACCHCHGYGCKRCSGDGYDTVYYDIELIIDPNDVHLTRYPYHSARDRSQVHFYEQPKHDDYDDEDDEEYEDFIKSIA